MHPISSYNPNLPPKLCMDYWYSFNGMEKDDEVKGAGNSYTTPFRQYDPRLGRWLTRDPIVQPWQSPYCAFDDNPIYYADPSGLKAGNGDKKEGGNKTKAGDDDWKGPNGSKESPNDLNEVTVTPQSNKDERAAYDRMKKQSPFLTYDHYVYKRSSFGSGRIFQYGYNSGSGSGSWVGYEQKMLEKANNAGYTRLSDYSTFLYNRARNYDPHFKKGLEYMAMGIYLAGGAALLGKQVSFCQDRE